MRIATQILLLLLLVCNSVVACQMERKDPEDTPTVVDNVADAKQKKAARILKAVAYHIKNLKDPDADVRESSCEMLGVLNNELAIGPLIDLLRPARNEPDAVKIAAVAALTKISGQNFGAEYKAWLGWWVHSNLTFDVPAESEK